MHTLFKVLVFLTYNDAPTEDGRFEPSLLLRAIGGWADIEQVDDAGVLPVKRKPDQARKARELFEEALAADPGKDGEGEEFQRLSQMKSDRIDWDQEFVTEMMARYERSLKLLDRMMQAGEMHLEAPKPWSSEADPAWKFLAFAKVYDARIRMHREAGNSPEAVEALATFHRYADFAMRSSGPLVHFLIAVACEVSALQAAERMLNDPELPAEAMAGIREILQAEPDYPRLLTEAWRHEYLYQRGVCRDLASGWTFEQFDLASLMGERELSIIDEVRGAVWRCGQQLVVAVGFQPNRTAARSARVIEFAMARTRAARPERSAIEPPALLEENRSWLTYLHPNGLGDWVVRQLLPANNRVIDRVDFLTAYRQTLLALWGVRSHYLLRNELPDSLEEMVPGVLAELPRDPYDGNAVKYSREKRWLWVVGEDGKDDGGTVNKRGGFRAERSLLTDGDDGYDPTLALEWLDKSPRSTTP